MPDVLPDPNSFIPEECDKYVSAQIKITLGYKEVIAKVKQRKRDINGKPIGIPNDNPFLNTRLYEVDLRDGAV